MKKHISGRLIRLFSILLVTMTIIIGLLFSVIFSKQTEDLHVEEMTHRGQVIQETLTDYFTTDTSSTRQRSAGNHNGMMGYGAYLNFINQIAGDSIWVVDQEQNTLLNGHHNSTTANTTMPKTAEKLIKEVYRTKQGAIEKEGSLLQLNAVTNVLPILVNGEVAGAIVMYSEVAAIHQNQANGYLILMISLVIALLVSILVSVRLAKGFTAPIKAMEVYTNALIAEEYPAALAINTEDELNELADRLSILSERLERAEKARRNKEQSEKEFLSQISHELRTPVMVMKSSLEALTDGLVDSPEEQRNYHEHLLKEADYLERLVNDLLELSRLQSVGFSLTMEKVDPLIVIEDAVRSYRLNFAEKQQEFVFHNQLTSPVYIKGDQGRLTQLLKNLLENAYKYSERKATIELFLAVTADQLHIQLRNPNNHSAALDQKELFQAFHRGDATTKEDGTGLGLAICQQIVQRHSGTIAFKEDSQKRVVVDIYFPIKQ
ncbi:sensor histidine kinase [Enterococcus sp. BWR-S5]|uniref:sensor histidine kinase n=1 Tax=Enterococcus sp. BWR-S5 TaxID=2787714 RepID=UPI001920EF60|nr:HAMP domain-containing sensor histidine kinase [Enterococcus sp. BWR-S5]MBL1226708.1 HAMP domain-containing histidine kinase [Enterococcus sp. BWR-S5]